MTISLIVARLRRFNIPVLNNIPRPPISSHLKMDVFLLIGQSNMAGRGDVGWEGLGSSGEALGDYCWR